MEPFRGVGLVHPPIWRRGTLQQDRLAVRWTDPTENEMDRWFGVTRDWPIGTPFPMTS
jgi:hypothetical protein